MQRMELYTSGVKVPRLGSKLDILSRAYLTHKINKEVAIGKILAYSASGVSKPEVSRDITSIWRNYVNLSYFLEEETRELESAMLAEYEKTKHISLKANVIVDSSGSRKVMISGIPEEFYK